MQPCKLLLNISGILLQLLANLGVVLGVLVLQGTSLLVQLCISLVTAILESGKNSVEGWDDAGEVVESATWSAESASLLVEESDEGFFGAAAAVVFALEIALGEELDGGVGLDAESLGGGFGGGGFAVDVGDCDAVFGGEVGGDLFPGGLEALAVCCGCVSGCMGLYGDCLNLRPHHGAVKATITSLSLTSSSKFESVNDTTEVAAFLAAFGLTPVFSVMKAVKLSRSRPLL